MDILRPYHAWLLEQLDLQTTKPEDIHPDVQEPLPCDAIVGRRVSHTRLQAIPLFQVAKAGQLPAQGKWYSVDELTKKFPHLPEQSMGTIAS